MDTRLAIVQGDITEQDVDVIVNAANPYLAHGGGVAAAIARAGAPVVDRESREWVERHGPVLSGSAAVTTAGDMKARNVIHVVGPVHQSDQDNERLLSGAVVAALDAAVGLGARSIALPAISTGIYGYPPAEACRVIVRTSEAWLGDGGRLDEIRLVAFDEQTARHFRSAR